MSSNNKGGGAENTGRRYDLETQKEFLHSKHPGTGNAATTGLYVATLSTLPTRFFFFKSLNSGLSDLDSFFFFFIFFFFFFFFFFLFSRSLTL
jgi:hypothetical protein